MRHKDTADKAPGSPPLRHFELIVDTCSSSEKVLNAVTQLIEYLQHHKSNTSFRSYRIVIPLQVGIEHTNYVFPEFLEAGLLKQTHRKYADFYNQHSQYVRCEETPASQIYLLTYAKFVSKFLGSESAHKKRASDGDYVPPTNRERIVASARSLATYYHKKLQTYVLLSKYPHCRSWQPDITDKTLNRLLERIHEIPNGSSAAIAEQAPKFIAGCTMDEKVLLQALYTDRKIYSAASDTEYMQQFRRNKGDLAIEEYIRTDHDKERRYASHADRTAMPPVYIVISDDRGVRDRVQALRRQPQDAPNQEGPSVFAISRYGLAKTFEELKLKTATPLVHDRVLDRVEEIRKLKSEATANGKTITIELDPDIEEKWAHNLVEMIQTGRWTSKKDKAIPSADITASSAPSTQQASVIIHAGDHQGMLGIGKPALATGWPYSRGTEC
jgi:hypothetical protein